MVITGARLLDSTEVRPQRRTKRRDFAHVDFEFALCISMRDQKNQHQSRSANCRIAERIWADTILGLVASTISFLMISVPVAELVSRGKAVTDDLLNAAP